LFTYFFFFCSWFLVFVCPFLFLFLRCKYQ
jgi:hypothetical protein